MYIYLTQLSYLKERSYLTMQEIFNKVDQNQLQRTKNVVYFSDATETLSISAGSISKRAEMSCGTPHTLQNRGMIVSYMPKGQWLIRCCCPIIGRGITDSLQILAILPSSLRCPPNNPPEGSKVVFPPLYFSRKIMKRRNV